MNRRQAGLTLMELMLILTVVGIVLGLALPIFGGAVAAGHTARARGDLHNSLVSALTHTTVSGKEVVLCASNDGAVCTGSPDWTRGWIVFVDGNGDRKPDQPGAVLRRYSELTGDVHLRSSVGRTRIVFQPHGGAAAGSNVTFTLCDRRGRTRATSLVVNNSGRIRQGVPTKASALACEGPG